MPEGGELASVVENGQHDIDHDCDHDDDNMHLLNHTEGAMYEVRHRKLGRPWVESEDLAGYGAVVTGDPVPTPCIAAAEPGSPKGGSEDAASLHKFWHRAGWLVLLLMFQSTSSVILEHFEVLIKSHPVVIYFLTMLVGAGGNAGGQSTVLVVRRLAVASVNGRDTGLSVRQIVGSELSVGAQLSVVLCLASFVRCVVFQVRGVECLAICLSMLVITFASTLVGAALPLLLRRLHVDPAHAGATIQVVMDISGVTLTCIVSCLVLGIPLSGKAAAVKEAVAIGAFTSREPVTPGAEIGTGITIQRERTLGLRTFGEEMAGADAYR